MKSLIKKEKNGIYFSSGVTSWWCHCTRHTSQHSISEERESERGSEREIEKNEQTTRRRMGIGSRDIPTQDVGQERSGGESEIRSEHQLDQGPPSSYSILLQLEKNLWSCRRSMRKQKIIWRLFKASANSLAKFSVNWTKKDVFFFELFFPSSYFSRSSSSDIVKTSSGPRYVVGCCRAVERERLVQGLSLIRPIGTILVSYLFLARCPSGFGHDDSDDYAHFTAWGWSDGLQHALGGPRQCCLQWRRRAGERE